MATIRDLIEALKGTTLRGKAAKNPSGKGSGKVMDPVMFPPVGTAITVVLGKYGGSVVVKIIGESPKALRLQNDSGDPANQGKTTWLPRSALKPNAVYTYKDFQAYTLAPWMVRKLDARARRALGLTTA